MNYLLDLIQRTPLNTLCGVWLAIVFFVGAIILGRFLRASLMDSIAGAFFVLVGIGSLWALFALSFAL